MAGTVELHGKSITVAWSDAWLRSAGRARRPSPHDPWNSIHRDDRAEPHLAVGHPVVGFGDFVELVGFGDHLHLAPRDIVQRFIEILWPVLARSHQPHTLEHEFGIVVQRFVADPHQDASLSRPLQSRPTNSKSPKVHPHRPPPSASRRSLLFHLRPGRESIFLCLSTWSLRWSRSPMPWNTGAPGARGLQYPPRRCARAA